MGRMAFRLSALSPKGIVDLGRVLGVCPPEGWRAGLPFGFLVQASTRSISSCSSLRSAWIPRGCSAPGERASLRALRRLLGVSVPTVLRWIQKSRLFAIHSGDIETS